MPAITVAQAVEVYETRFAGWIRDLDLRFETLEEGRLRLRMPHNPRLVRRDGVLCGQALMAAADTGMVFAVASALGEFRPMATVSQSTTFMRPAPAADILIEVDIIKTGRRLVFGEVTMYEAGSDEPLAHVTSTYALLPRRQP